MLFVMIYHNKNHHCRTWKSLVLGAHIIVVLHSNHIELASRIYGTAHDDAKVNDFQYTGVALVLGNCWLIYTLSRGVRVEAICTSVIHYIGITVRSGDYSCSPSHVLSLACEWTTRCWQVLIVTGHKI